jgi:Ser/Thr protein kinase RdoA (MazF antagonist)
LIHADLVPENVLVGPRGVRIIDFDDAGFGWHLFELATSVYFIRREACFPMALASFVSGYREHRALSEQHLRRLDMFLAVRGTTYLGWVHTRKGEATASEMTPALVDLAVSAAEDYLSAPEHS